jgi:hypothetical protein
MCYNYSLRLKKLYDFSHMEDQEELAQKLADYKREHKALDDGIARALQPAGEPVNLFHIQQMKKKKLWLKDMIQKLESALIDDIIA